MSAIAIAERRLTTRCREHTDAMSGTSSPSVIATPIAPERPVGVVDLTAGPHPDRAFRVA